MKTLALVVDERELSTIEAALLLLQEQINALPEDLSEMMSEPGAPLTEMEVGELARRISMRRRPLTSLSQVGLPRAETVVAIERATEPTLASKGRAEEPREPEPTPYELCRI
jgi:hypothetical protein